MLRQHGSQIHIEFLLANKDEYERFICEQYLPLLNARCIILTDLTSNDETDGNPPFEVFNYQLEMVALLSSSFNRVLLLDSDSVPLVNPDKSDFLKRNIHQA